MMTSEEKYGMTWPIARPTKPKFEFRFGRFSSACHHGLCRFSFVSILYFFEPKRVQSKQVLNTITIYRASYIWKRARATYCVLYNFKSSLSSVAGHWLGRKDPPPKKKNNEIKNNDLSMINLVRLLNLSSWSFIFFLVLDILTKQTNFNYIRLLCIYFFQDRIM